jgi:hypothetical protein
MGSMEWITPSTLAIPVMRNSTRMKHVASSSLVVQESKSDISKVLEVSKLNHRFLCHLKEPKIPSRASRSRSFLNDPTDFQIQSILASFNVKHVISINLITPAHTDALVPTVTTQSEIIPYYRLNNSIWSLSDNKESSHWVLPGLHSVNHLKTQRGSIVCIETLTKESPECLTN